MLTRLPEDERSRELSRTVVVSNVQAWNQLAAAQAGLLLIPMFNVGDAIARAVRGGNQILVPLGRDDSTYDGTLVLSRLHIDDIATALVGIGITEERSRTLAKTGRRSLMALRRRLAIRPELQQPAWAKPATARDVLPALLAGGWDDTNEADRAAIARLAGRPYDEVSTQLTQWANEADAPVRKIGNAWYLVSKEDAWRLVARYLGRDDLERFTSVALDILAERDPALDVSVSERWSAGLLGKVLSYSGLLRGGLVDTLAIMGARSDSTVWGDTISPQDRASVIVRQLLTSANETGALWASLYHHLSALAEAAPGEFLRAAELGPGANPEIFASIFEEASTGLFAHTKHDGLLWALEVLAWHPDYLSRASLVLAQLARQDRNRQRGNNPMDSLRRIFLWWRPCTMASIEQRLAVIDMLRQREPAIAWQLMGKLLPELHSHTTPTSAPDYRDWVPDKQATLSRAQMWGAEQEIVTRMLQDVGSDGERWALLISRLDDVQLPQHTAIATQMAEIDHTTLTAEDRRIIWDTLRELVSRHREFPDAVWAMSTDLVDNLQAIYDRFTPADPVEKYQWVFASNPRLIRPHDETWDGRANALRTTRVDAARAMYQAGGLPLLQASADQVELPGELGIVVSGQQLLTPEEEDAGLAQGLSSERLPQRLFTRGLICGAVDSQGYDWAKTKLAAGKAVNWSVRQRADFYIGLPFNSTTWDLLETSDLETQQLYWSTVHAGWVSAADCERAVRKLLAHGRPHRAIDYISGLLVGPTGILPVPAEITMQALEAALYTPIEKGDNLDPIRHYVSDLLDAIERSGEIDQTRIARLEFTLLPLLEHTERGARLLNKALAHDPEFFLEVVGLYYGVDVSQGDDDQADVDQEARKAERQARWDRAFTLIQNWRLLPGTTDDGSISAGELRAWVGGVREQAANSGRAEIADEQIGRILSYAPKDPDGSWPCVAVLDVIEEYGSEALLDGFCVGVANQRGVITKALFETGDQERTLATRYRDYAAMIRDRWPHTASALNLVADGYSAAARNADTKGELDEDLI